MGLIAVGCGPSPSDKDAEIRKLKNQVEDMRGPKRSITSPQWTRRPSIAARNSRKESVDHVNEPFTNPTLTVAPTNLTPEEKELWSLWVINGETTRGPFPSKSRRGIAEQILNLFRTSPGQRGSLKIIDHSQISTYQSDYWAQRVKIRYLNSDWEPRQQNQVFLITKGEIAYIIDFDDWPTWQRPLKGTPRTQSTHFNGPQ